MPHLNHILATALLAALAGCGVSASGTIATTPTATTAPAAAAPTAAPTTAPTLPPPSAEPSPDACAMEFASFNVTRDLRLSYQEYEDGKWKQLRFIKAPTAAEEAQQRQAFRNEAIGADLDKDGHLSMDEFKALCSKD